MTKADIAIDVARSHPPRLVFANQLRGFAALAVALNHLAGVFWTGQGIVSSVTMTPPQGGDIPKLYFILNPPHLNSGPLGVAVFFLISGLVIPISLEQHSTPTFIAARLLRIYPTYWAAFAIDLAVLWFNSKYWHQPWVYAPRTILANVLLIYNFMSENGMDLVSWSLVIELKFYLVMAFVSASVLRGNVGTVVAIGTGLLAATFLVGAPLYAWLDEAAPWIGKVVGLEAPYLTFMLIGVLFNFNLRGRLSNLGLIAGSIGMLAIFFTCWFGSIFTGPAPLDVPWQYLYALVIFGTLFAFRRFVPKIKILEFMANISFPFYLIHSMLGYSLLKLMMISGHIPYYPALIVTFLAAGVVATGLHVTVERWSIRAGKQLGRRARAGLGPTEPQNGEAITELNRAAAGLSRP